MLAGLSHRDFYTYAAFTTPATESEAIAAAKGINSDYDHERSAKENHLEAMKKRWLQDPVQSQGVEVYTRNPPPADLLSFRYLRKDHRQWVKLVLSRVNLLPTRSVLHRVDKARAVECRLCGKHRETNLHAVNGCEQMTEAMIHRHNKVRDRCLYALKSDNTRNLTIDLEKRIMTPTCSYLLPDVIIHDKDKANVHIIDFAVAYETDARSLEHIAKGKVSKYSEIVDACSRMYNVTPNSVQVLPLVVGSRGAIPSSLINNLNILGLSRYTARNMAQTSAEQTLTLFNQFTHRRGRWRPSRLRKRVTFEG